MSMNRLTNWIRRSKAQVLPKTTRNTISNKTTNKINMATIIKTNHRTVKTLLLRPSIKNQLEESKQSSIKNLPAALGHFS